ncbi:MAG: efflux RND transporter periplasmic adaptor subunit [Fuerstiella sp.]|nr:efflux RND transporter periplasmic adaptor subunit [Fuerstiella sp.]MCP4511113.1 efflux RND transporter periplasmic adaptor subunit [Fuerstiella sp.]
MENAPVVPTAKETPPLVARHPDSLDASASDAPLLKRRVTHVANATIEDLLGHSIMASGVTAVPSIATTVPNARSSPVTAEFSEELHAALFSCVSLEDAQAATADVLQKSAGAVFVGWHTAATRQIGSTDRLEGLTCPVDELAPDTQKTLVRIARDAALQRKTVVASITAERSVATSVPVSPTCSLVAIINDTDECDNVARQTGIDLAAAKISQWLLAKEARQLLKNSEHVAALVDLTGRILECKGADDAHRSVVAELKRFLGASSVLLGICPEETTACGLAVSSEVADIDRFSDATRITESALQESIARSTASIYPTSDSGNRHALLAHQQFADCVGAVSVVGCPLRTATGVNVGAILVTFGAISTHDNTCTRGVPPEQTAARAKNTLGFLRAGERSIANALNVQNRSSRTVTRLIRSAIGTALTKKVARTTAMVTAALAAVLSIPMDYKVQCDLELQPVSRRFVAAPFSAPLKDCLVEPGDVVQANDLLARLDGRELTWELAGIRADIGKARNEYNSHLSGQEFGLAAIARHELERLETRAALLSAREKNLEIRSPMNGVVVSGDLKDTEGVPLETGQSMFEVAPLDRMVVEIEIPEEDVRHVRSNMTLSFHLNAMPSETFNAQILRIHPRGELRDQENVFVAEAEFENGSTTLRPGMKGTAKVSTGARAIGWNLFHKPVAHITGWLGW